MGRARGLRPSHKKALEKVLAERGEGKNFGGVGEVWLEIGFGDGAHMLYELRARPYVSFLGCEIYEKGIAQCFLQAGTDTNRLWLYKQDAREFLGRLPQKSVSRVFVLFPDPWKKRRHRKRRIFEGDMPKHIARVLVLGGEVRFATDNFELAAWTVGRMAPHFEPERWYPSGPPTRYEAKAGRENCVYLRFRRKLGTRGKTV